MRCTRSGGPNSLSVDRTSVLASIDSCSCSSVNLFSDISIVRENISCQSHGFVVQNVMTLGELSCQVFEHVKLIQFTMEEGDGATESNHNYLMGTKKY
jgi:hypothetical protein